jgi:hypothetical protein
MAFLAVAASGAAVVARAWCQAHRRAGAVREWRVACDRAVVARVAAARPRRGLSALEAWAVDMLAEAQA